MTKGELIKVLQPFDDDIVIRTLTPGNDGDTLGIKHARYFIFDDYGEIVLCPMGCHLKELEDLEQEQWRKEVQ